MEKNSIVLVILLMAVCGAILLIDNSSNQPQPLSIASPQQHIARNSSGEKLGLFNFLAFKTCTPSPGYNACIYNSYGYGEATANAEIQISNLIGQKGVGIIEGQQAEYFVGGVAVNVEHIGDKLYVETGKTSFENLCMEGGCSGKEISDGQYVIATAPAKNPPLVYFLSWDFDSDEYDNWAWTDVEQGWVGNPPNWNFYVLNCYNNSDCASGEYCDKSGSWDTWACKVDPCANMPAPENKCVGTDLWSQKCSMGQYVQDQLIEKNSLNCGYDACANMPAPPNTCIGTDLWSQKCYMGGYVRDQIVEANSAKCGYDACANMPAPQNKCYGFDLWSQKCSGGAYVKDQLVQANSATCGYPQSTQSTQTTSTSTNSNPASGTQSTFMTYFSIGLTFVGIIVVVAAFKGGKK